MSSSRFPEELDSIPLVTAGRTPITGNLINYLLSANKSMEDAIGADPLTSSVYTLQSTLADQFKEFFRIECGEVEKEFMEAPKTDNATVNTGNQGQNAVITGGTYWLSTAKKLPTPSVGWTTGQPRIYFKNPEIFDTTITQWYAGTGNLFFHASIVAVMSSQGDWEEASQGNWMPLPADWPETYTVALSPLFISNRLAGLDAWIEMGGMCGLVPDSSGNFPKTFSKGDKVKIRYMAMEVKWL